MDCQKFNTLSSDQRLDYIYRYCRLVDFEIVSERYHRYGVCLYHDGKLFIEVRFDGLQGDRVKEMKTYNNVQALTRWYERIDLTDLLSHPFEQ